MLKGTNKQIVEVVSTESPYFEKIIFFVRPRQGAVPEQQLKREAESLTQKMKKPPRVKLSAKQIIRAVLFGVMGAGAGAALTFLIGYIA